MKITINGVEYTLRFGYGCLRCLSVLWGLSNVNEVIGHAGVQNEAGRSIEVCVDIVRASIAASGENEPGVDDIGDFLMQNPEKIGGIINLFVESLPVLTANETGKPKAQQKTK